MMSKEFYKEDTAIDYLGYALYAFGGLGIEMLLMMIETNLWGVQNSEWTVQQNIMHWCITCGIWLLFSVLLLKKTIKTKLQANDINWLGVGAIVMCSILYTSYVWGGFKPAIELQNIGSLKFIVQYMYYAFESMLILLIVVHGQHAFETLIKKSISIPIGGILLATTWGLMHIVTQGVHTGLYTCIQSILFGIVYILLKKDIRFSYLAITFMFML